MTLFQDAREAIACACPRCHRGKLFQDGLLNLSLNDRCAVCGLDLAKNDSADGPAVFLIFILGFLVVPLALLTDHVFAWPIWIHLLVWTPLCLAVIVGLLKPVKAFVLALQWKVRPSDWSA